jgi:hypothetical protein
MSLIAEALRDWEYIKKSALKVKFDDPFIMTSEKSHDLALLKEVVQEWREEAATARSLFRGDEKHLISKLDEDIKSWASFLSPGTSIIGHCLGARGILLIKKRRQRGF